MDSASPSKRECFEPATQITAPALFSETLQCRFPATIGVQIRSPQRKLACVVGKRTKPQQRGRLSTCTRLIQLLQVLVLSGGAAFGSLISAWWDH